MPTAQEVITYLENVKDIFGDFTVNDFIEVLKERLEDED